MPRQRARFGGMILALCLLGNAPASAQSGIVGTELPEPTEVRAIVAGLHAITVEERVELAMERLCRADVRHPDCPSNLKNTRFEGRLPGSVWFKSRTLLNADEKMGKHRGSLKKATFVYIQRPVALGDSIVMLVQLTRQPDGAPREKLMFDIVLRGDSAKMEVLHYDRRVSP